MTNRKRPRFVGVWLSDVGLDSVDEKAKTESMSRSSMLRLMIAFAIRRMPKGWRP